MSLLLGYLTVRYYCLIYVNDTKKSLSSNMQVCLTALRNLQNNTPCTRYFVAEKVFDEVIFGWARQKGGSQLKELLDLRLQKAITSVRIVIELIHSLPF